MVYHHCKSFCALLCALVLLCTLTGSATASGFSYFHKEEQISFAKSCLTEVFGYSYEESELFVFEQTEQDGIATVRYWHPDFPQWVYTSQFSLTDGQRLANVTPFGSEYNGYPGENSVRWILTQVQEQNLLSHWDKAAREAFRNILEQDGLKPNADLDKGLLSATYTAQDALEDFFATCYGIPEEWPEAVTEWYQWFLNTYQLELPKEAAVAEGVTRYRSEGENPMVLTEFVRSMPPELADVLNHPMLEGWQVLSGATVDFDASDDSRSSQTDLGLIALGKDKERLLCLLQKKENDSSWIIHPVSRTALPAGCEPVITRSDSMSVVGGNRYQIQFDTELYKDVTMLVGLYWQTGDEMLCRLIECRFTDAATGDIYQANESDSLYQISCIRSQATQDKAVTITDCAYPSSLTHLDTKAFLEMLKHPETSDGFRLPEGMVLISGVHLRKETSSHSRDLGTLNGGTIAKKLSIEAGDPDPWYQVEIGLLKGYVSSVYVEETLGRSAQLCLPVAMAKEKCSLKEHTGLFATELAQVESGTTMHIIMDKGGWYYVCIPQTQPAGMWMDPQGVYGYVKASQVLVGSNALQLEWQLAVGNE